MGLDESVNELISSRIADGSVRRRVEYTTDNGPKVYYVDLRVAITAGECGGALTQ